MFRPPLALFLLLFPWLAFSASAQNPKVLNRISPEKLETLLKSLTIDFKKSPHETIKDAFRYDFERNEFKIRLINFKGEDLWIESIFNEPLELKEVNSWNVKAKFSRCVLIPGDKDKKAAASISLESQLDCSGGATEGMVGNFITRFYGELKDFSKYITK